VIWPPPPDWTGADAGAWKPPWPAEEFDEFEEPFEEAAPEPAFAAPPDEVPEEVPEEVPDAEPPEETLAFDEPREEAAVLCVEPGSAAATAPAATTLAKPTVAVVTFSLRRPRSRSATACETPRPPKRDPCQARDDPLPSPASPCPASLMPSVWHTYLHSPSARLLRAL
jgi:hypothetical protein